MKKKFRDKQGQKNKCQLTEKRPPEIEITINRGRNIEKIIVLKFCQIRERKDLRRKEPVDENNINLKILFTYNDNEEHQRQKGKF